MVSRKNRVTGATRSKSFLEKRHHFNTEKNISKVLNDCFCLFVCVLQTIFDISGTASAISDFKQNVAPVFNLKRLKFTDRTPFHLPTPGIEPRCIDKRAER